MFEILLEYNWYLNLHLDRNTNFPPSAHFRFPNVVLRKEKLKKEKWQCSQNLKLNPTYVTYLFDSPLDTGKGKQ